MVAVVVDGDVRGCDISGSGLGGSGGENSEDNESRQSGGT